MWEHYLRPQELGRKPDHLIAYPTSIQIADTSFTEMVLDFNMNVHESVGRSVSKAFLLNVK